MKAFLQKQYIVAGSAFIVLVVACGAFVWMLDSMKQKEVRVHEVKQTLATYQQNKKLFAKESQTLSALTSRLGALENVRVTTLTLPSLLSSIESVARESGVTITITSAVTPEEDGKQVLYITLSGEGGADRLQSFIDSIEHQTYQVRVQKFSLHRNAPSGTPDGKAQSDWSMLATLQIMSY